MIYGNSPLLFSRGRMDSRGFVRPGKSELEPWTQEVRTGLLDGPVEMPLGRLSYGQRHALVASALHAFHHEDLGGVAGLARSLCQLGLTEAVASWIGAVRNQPMTAEQVQTVFGAARVARIAETAGVSASLASAAVAQILPMLFERLAQDGRIPDGAGLESRLDRLRRALLSM